ncbi:MAG: RNA polymerase sigma factor RpoE [Planctomycetota bacterium]
MRQLADNAFEALALPELGVIYRVARRLTRNEAEAEDLVQETYLKAQTAFASFQLQAFGIRPWLLRILNNSFLNRVARDRRAPRHTDNEILESFESASGAANATRQSLDFDHLDDEVKAAIEGLQPEFRAVLLLWATMEYSYQEIADIIDVPIGTVMSRLHRAKRLMSDALRGYAREHRLAAERDAG